MQTHGAKSSSKDFQIGFKIRKMRGGSGEFEASLNYRTNKETSQSQV